jgi:hypothetical protein
MVPRLPPRQDLYSRIAAALVVALVVGLTIRFNTFPPWATDAGAYVTAGHQWATHRPDCSRHARGMSSGVSAGAKTISPTSRGHATPGLSE